MLIEDRLRALREAKGLTQDDAKELRGTMRAFNSGIENEHVLPSIEA
jgi:DNA-binding XRE family transcriptional regulator